MNYKSVLFAALFVASALPAVSAAQGVSIGYPSFIDYTTWNLYGSASVTNSTPGNGFTYSLLRLTTPGTGGQAGAAFAPSTTTLDFDQAFNFNFSFYTSPGSVIPGDGMTFVLTSDDPASATLGSPGSNGGSNLGYGGSGLTGLAFAIDTFNFSGEPAAPSIQILENGSATPVAYTETGLTSIYDPSYFQWNANIDFTPSGSNDGTGTLTGRIDQFVGSLSFSVSTTVDGNALNLNGLPIYYGFTAANGLADDGHTVSSAMAVPEPETYAMLLAGLGLVGWRFRSRR
jgi:hypothetical protein